MTIGPDFVFLCVPRTASVSISRHWLLHYGGQEYLPNENYYHAQVVPAEHAHKFTFAVVRNPLDRLLSLWRMVKKLPDEELSTIAPGQPKADIEMFLDWLQLAKHDSRFLSQTAFLSEATIDRVIRFEQLEEQLKTLPFVNVWHELPHTNETVSQPLPNLSSSVWGKIYRFIRADEIAYGY